MTSYCEDAPCCGCCGTGVYGNNNPEPDYDPYDNFYDDYDQDDYLDPSDCSHDQGDYDDIDPLKGTVTCARCLTEGVSFTIMGEDVYRFPVTKDTGTYYGGGEDRHLDEMWEL